MEVITKLPDWGEQSSHLEMKKKSNFHFLCESSNLRSSENIKFARISKVSLDWTFDLTENQL